MRGSDSLPDGHDWEDHIDTDGVGYNRCLKCLLVSFSFPGGVDPPSGCFSPTDDSFEDCLSRQVLGT